MSRPCSLMVSGSDRPCLKALRADRALPSGVRGPVTPERRRGPFAGLSSAGDVMARCLDLVLIDLSELGLFDRFQCRSQGERKGSTTAVNFP